MVSMYFFSNLKALFEDIGDRAARRIPAEKYARFVVRGNMQRAAAGFWQELWTMNLPRSFVCDFEEYQNSDMGKRVIAIWLVMLRAITVHHPSGIRGFLFSLPAHLPFFPFPQAGVSFLGRW